MNPHAIFVLALTGIALVLFSRERIPIETSALAVLAVLAIGFELVPFHDADGVLHATDLFLGFGHEALVAVSALMIAGQGLVRTGALEPVGRALGRLWSVAPALSLLATLLFGAVLSAFVNNTPVVVLLLPILVGVSLRAGRPPSDVLMPMGFATLVGGMATTIGTSTNLLVVAVAADLGMRRLELFDFLLPAAIAGGIGIVYLWLVAPRLLPARTAPMADTSPRVFEAALVIEETSFAAEKKIRELLERAGSELRIAHVQRGAGVEVAPLPDVRVRPGDRLIVRDTPDRLKAYEAALGTPLYSGDERLDFDAVKKQDDEQIAEVVITTGSPFVGMTLRGARFADRFRLTTLALHRSGRALSGQGRHLNDTPLRPGDVLLVQGARERLAEIKRNGELLLLDATADLPRSRRAPIAAAIMIGIVAAAAFGLLSIAVAAVVGVLLMLITRCLSWPDVGRALSPAVILIIVASLALGIAMTRTGATRYLAEQLVIVMQGASPAVLLSALMLLMALVTNVVSNNAAAVIGTPIAISIANDLALPPEPFVLAILFGANMSFATPMAYKTNLLVMNAGGYSFGDFLRAGLPLTLLMWAVFSFLLPMLYPIAGS
ncbi:MAG: SLC13 family permease [Chromatiales bacterium]|nr:SLC13 family permease [Chromatiales bacterium]